MAVADAPIWVAQLDLSDAAHLEALSRRPSADYGQARVLIRLDHDAIGFIELSVPPEGLTAEVVSEVARTKLHDTIRSHRPTIGVPPNGELPPISIVLCTRNRPGAVAACLRSLQSLRYEAFEVVVVDNAPDDDATHHSFVEAVGDDGRFRYLRELEPGLSRARNRGLAEAKHAYVAFTDDDAIVDPWWLRAIASGFAREPGVGCVTGLVTTGSLDDRAERYFDRHVPWSERLTPQRYDAAARRSQHFPFDAGLFGTGANFTVDRQLVMGLGGFDVALGAGSPSCGGEDLDIFVRVLRAGRVLAYEPSAVVWHFHRAEASELRRQMRSYGIGFVSFLMKQLRDPAARRFFVRLAPRAAMHVTRRSARDGRAAPGGAPFVFEELWGYVVGVLAYRKAQHAAKRSLASRND